MGIVFKVKTGTGYLNKRQWSPAISHHRAVKALTRQNQQFLIRLGLKLRH